jgi:murein DD-endopeptidase MepM/ murein hydrolase activator NlpD
MTNRLDVLNQIVEEASNAVNHIAERPNPATLLVEPLSQGEIRDEPGECLDILELTLQTIVKSSFGQLFHKNARLNDSPIYAPMSGVVTCAGTNNGAGVDKGRCAAFNDYFGGGAGRIKIRLDNGAVLIFGHSSRANVSPGQRVSAGTMLGTSGGMNSPHIHLEARVRDASMPSGWRIVDPRTVLGGAVGVPTVPGAGSFGTGNWWGGTGFTGYGAPSFGGGGA